MGTAKTNLLPLEISLESPGKNFKFRQSLGNPIVKCKHKTAATEFCQCSLLFARPPPLRCHPPGPRLRLHPPVLLLLKLAFEFGLFLCVIIYLICCCHLATFFPAQSFLRIFFFFVAALGLTFCWLGFDHRSRAMSSLLGPLRQPTPPTRNHLPPPPTGIVIDAAMRACCFYFCIEAALG